MTKFSILLPTKDRLDLLKAAIETIRLQDYEDWEIIVSDNNSEADIKGYIKSLKEPRIKYIRTDKSIDVTANWNNAYEAASGEYITMLGDDDALVPDYFKRMEAYLSDHDEPDFIYHSAYHFAFPDTLKDYPQGFLQDITPAQFLFKNKTAPYVADKKTQEKLVKAALDLRLLYSFNMQYFIFKREFLESLKNQDKLFYGPYPDFYLANVAFTKTDSALILPMPMTIIGISPKSYGYFHFNGDEKSAVTFLKNEQYAQEIPDDVRKKLLPGSEMNTQWLISVMRASNYLKETTGENHYKTGFTRYRILQIFNTMIKACSTKSDIKTAANTLWPELSTFERVLLVTITGLALPLWILPVRIKDVYTRLLFSLTGQYEAFFKLIACGIVGLSMKVLGLRYHKPWSSKRLTSGIKDVVEAYRYLGKIEGIDTKGNKNEDA